MTRDLSVTVLPTCRLLTRAHRGDIVGVGELQAKGDIDIPDFK